MPDLPGLDNLSQATINRCIATWGDVATYKAWLARQVRAEVLKHELAAFDAQQEATRAALIANLKQEIPNE